MNGFVVKPLSRFLALFIAFTLTLPTPSSAMRQTGLEESPKGRQNLPERSEVSRSRGAAKVR